MNMRTLGCFATIVLACWFMGGCATILNGDHQPVSFSSAPENATVTIDGVAMGRTPCVIPVARKGGDKIIQFQLSGYKTVIIELDNKIAAAGFGNILFGGLIGAGIDAASGRAGSYQKSLHIVLEAGTGTINLDVNNAQAPDTKEESADSQPKPSASNTDEVDDDKYSEYSESTRKWIYEKSDQ